MPPELYNFHATAEIEWRASTWRKRLIKNQRVDFTNFNMHCHLPDVISPEVSHKYYGTLSVETRIFITADKERRNKYEAGGLLKGKRKKCNYHISKLILKVKRTTPLSFRSVWGYPHWRGNVNTIYSIAISMTDTYTLHSLDRLHTNRRGFRFWSKQLDVE